MATLPNIEGLDELRAALQSVPSALRRRQILRSILAAGGRVFRDEAQRLSPVLKVPVRKRGKVVRKPGTVRNAITVRTSRRDKQKGDVGVFVNVRPAKGASKTRASQRGADSPDDPFYWRWLEFGRKARAGEPARAKVLRIKGTRRGVRARRRLRGVGAIAPMGFLRGAVTKANEAMRRIEAATVRAIKRMNRKGGTK